MAGKGWWPAGTVRSQASRGLTDLRRVLGPDLDELHSDGVKMSQCARPHNRQHDSQHRPAAGEGHAFGEHLADQTRPSRAERRANRNLLLTGGSARQQHVGKIRADNQHHHTHGACQHEKSRAQTAADVFAQETDSCREIVAIPRVSVREVLR